MTRAITREALAQSKAVRTVRRVGLAADLDGTDADLFTIANGIVLVTCMFGHVTTIIGAGLAVPRIQFTPAGGAQTPLNAAAASIATDVVDTIYVWDGIAASQMIPSGTIGAGGIAATGDWLGGFVGLVPGVIALTNAVSALSGVIDWYISYIPLTDTAVITAA